MQITMKSVRLESPRKSQIRMFSAFVSSAAFAQARASSFPLIAIIYPQGSGTIIHALRRTNLKYKWPSMAPHGSGHHRALQCRFMVRKAPFRSAPAHPGGAALVGTPPADKCDPRAERVAHPPRGGRVPDRPHPLLPRERFPPSG